MDVCMSCGRRGLALSVTATGRRLCADCAERLLGAEAGVIAGGGVEGGIATAGWFQRVRARRRARRSERPDEG